MKHLALTAKYRPQTFAQVAGQDMVKTILSRAGLEDKVAPAYLFSGTRGVGKTTLARIFAKALNCRTAPVAEPCNECDQCRAVMQGNAVDVVEIDGASNRGIDDVRRLREVVGYAPMEGRYKVFIIDEAHMLSREAFNALLKTLEEPPARVTFVLATTEPHKFPATIISRCQHYVFKRLPEKGLIAHLAEVLGKEGIDSESAALRLIARRGAGSVRDAMSLLSQVIALGEDGISESSARSVLGLAGQEVFSNLLEALHKGDGPALSLMLKDLLDQGLDMGFFLRELASLWRNLFMLRQSGEAALELVELPENEARHYLELSRAFSLQHIHACWQMTLEGQRRVLTSLEPALALELLLLNLAMLPRLISLESLSSMGRKADAGGSGQGQGPGPGQNQGSGQDQGQNQERGGAATPGASGQGMAPAATPAPAPGRGGTGSLATPVPHAAAPVPASAEVPVPAAADAEAVEHNGPDEADIQSAMAELFALNKPDEFAEPEARTVPAEGQAPQAPVKAAPAAALPPWPDWQAVISLGEERQVPAWLLSLLKRIRAERKGDSLELTPPDAFAAERLQSATGQLRDLLQDCCAAVPPLVIAAPARHYKSPEEIKSEVLEHPLVREMQQRFGARYLDSGRNPDGPEAPRA